MKQEKDGQFCKCNTLTVNLQKFVQLLLYEADCTPMKQRNVVVDRVRVAHTLFRSSRKSVSGNWILHSNHFPGKNLFTMVAMLH